MVVKSYESKSTVDKLKELEKIVFKTHNPLAVQDVMKNVEEYANTIYNQALDDLLKQMKERADDCSYIPNMFDKGYYQAYEHMCYEAEQLKK